VLTARVWPSVRDAIPDDAPGIAALLGELGYPATAVEADEHIRRFAADAASRLQVAELDGDVVGLVATHIVPRLDRDRVTCRITDIVVSSTHRRCGVGSALLAAAEHEARVHGARRLDLSWGDHRADAHAFYTRMGFETRSRGFTWRLA
jgi:GNAT superfamily N-acetyltransferase